MKPRLSDLVLIAKVSESISEYADTQEEANGYIDAELDDYQIFTITEAIQNNLLSKQDLCRILLFHNIY